MNASGGRTCKNRRAGVALCIVALLAAAGGVDGDESRKEQRPSVRTEYILPLLRTPLHERCSRRADFVSAGVELTSVRELSRDVAVR